MAQPQTVEVDLPAAGASRNCHGATWRFGGFKGHLSKESWRHDVGFRRSLGKNGKRMQTPSAHHSGNFLKYPNDWFNSGQCELIELSLVISDPITSAGPRSKAFRQMLCFVCLAQIVCVCVMFNAKMHQNLYR